MNRDDSTCTAQRGPVLGDSRDTANGGPLEIMLKALPPRGHSAKSGDIPGGSHPGRGCYWHLEGEDQRGCSASHSAQHAQHRSTVRPQGPRSAIELSLW